MLKLGLFAVLDRELFREGMDGMGLGSGCLGCAEDGAAGEAAGSLLAVTGAGLIQVETNEIMLSTED